MVKARSPVENKVYAVKVIDKQRIKAVYGLASDTKILKEVRSLSRLDHPSVARYHSFFPGDQEASATVYLCIRMDFYPGGALVGALSKTTPVPKIKRQLRQLAEGFQYLERMPVIHRDFKADNVMLDQDGHLKIIDFGLATPAETSTSSLSSLQSLQERRGNPLYQSPEMRAGAKIGCRHDMYALGLVLAEMLLGDVAQLLLVSSDSHFGFDPKSGKQYIAPEGIGKLRADAETKDKGLSGIVDGLLERQPADRTAPAGIIAALNDIERGSLGARLAGSSPEVQASRAWIDRFRQLPPGALGGILQRLKGPSQQRLVSGAEEADARTVARSVLAGGSAVAGLTEDEATALYLYTTDAVYTKLNAGLRDPGANAAELNAVTPFARLLDAGLSKLPSVDRTQVIRGGSFEFGSSKGDIIRWRAFTSASKNGKTALQFAGNAGRRCMFYILSKTGKHIRRYAEPGFKGEEEVLFRPGTPFRVEDVTFYGQGLAVAVLQELDDV